MRFYQVNTAMYHHNDFNGLSSAGNPAYFTPPTYLRDERSQYLPTYNTLSTHIQGETYQYTPAGHTPPTFSRDERHQQKTRWYTPPTYIRDERPQYIPTFHTPPTYVREERHKHIPVYHTPATYIRDNDPGYTSRGHTYCRTAPLEDRLHGHYVAGTAATPTLMPHHMTIHNANINPVSSPYQQKPVDTHFVITRHTVSRPQNSIPLEHRLVQKPDILSQSFQSTDIGNKVRNKIHSCTQQEFENPRSYAERLQELCMTEFPNAPFPQLKKLMIEQFIAGLRHSRLTQYIKLCKPSTLAEAVDKIETYLLDLLLIENESVRRTKIASVIHNTDTALSKLYNTRYESKKDDMAIETTETCTANETVQPCTSIETVQPTEQVQFCRATETLQPCIVIETVKPTEPVQTCISVEIEQPDIAIETEQPDIAIETEQPDISIEIEQPDIATETEQPDIAIEIEQLNITIETEQHGISIGTVKPVKAIDNDITYANEYFCLNRLYAETVEKPVSCDITCLNEHLHLELLFAGEAVNDQVKVTGLVSRPEIQPMQFLKGQLVTPVRQKMSYAQITEQTFNVNKQFSCYSSYLDIYQNVCFQESVVAKECILT